MSDRINSLENFIKLFEKELQEIKREHSILGLNDIAFMEENYHALENTHYKLQELKLTIREFNVRGVEQLKCVDCGAVVSDTKAMYGHWVPMCDACERKDIEYMKNLSQKEASAENYFDKHKF